MVGNSGRRNVLGNEQRSMVMNRAECLEKANKCVNGQRDVQYGMPEDNFGAIAKLWNVYLAHINRRLVAHDVACMLALLKIARIASGQPKEDNWIDLAGYAACGGEIQIAAKK